MLRSPLKAISRAHRPVFQRGPSVSDRVRSPQITVVRRFASDRDTDNADNHQDADGFLKGSEADKLAMERSGGDLGVDEDVDLGEKVASLQLNASEDDLLGLESELAGAADALGKQQTSATAGANEEASAVSAQRTGSAAARSTQEDESWDFNCPRVQDPQSADATAHMTNHVKATSKTQSFAEFDRGAGNWRALHEASRAIPRLRHLQNYATSNREVDNNKDAGVTPAAARRSTTDHRSYVATSAEGGAITGDMGPSQVSKLGSEASSVAGIAPSEFRVLTKRTVRGETKFGG